MVLPAEGSANWGVPLSAEITIDETNIAANATAISAHATGVDPHGDRAYAATLITPITGNTNLANGYLVLDNTGHVPSALNTLSLPLTITANANNTSAETIIAQYQIPSGDPVAGISGYDFRTAGTIIWISAPTLTLRVRLGTLGTTSDAQFASSMVPTLVSTQSTTLMWDVSARVGIDGSGNWWPMGVSADFGSSISAKGNGTTSMTVAAGIAYVTLTAQWGTAASGNNIITKVGQLQRIRV